VRIDCFVGISEITTAEIAGRSMAVIDVLRATTTIPVALSSGARAVIPLENAEEVVLRSKSFGRGEVLLAGERKMLMVPGFDLGNSPSQFTREAVDGKTVLFATTNGTPALVSVAAAREVMAASYVNFSAVAAVLLAALRAGHDVGILCSGRERHFSLEDAACAGRFVRVAVEAFPAIAMNDGARACALVDATYREDRARLFADADHGKALAEAGFTGDLELAGALDAFPVVPVYQDRQITKLGPDREQ
jgi:2-phosphosulfolactate phosphatase